VLIGQAAFGSGGGDAFNAGVPCLSINAPKGFACLLLISRVCPITNLHLQLERAAINVARCQRLAHASLGCAAALEAALFAVMATLVPGRGHHQVSRLCGLR
jgi:hypothetical protein